MGLRCSLLGHDYGDSFVERDREERGNEVVVTERELTECLRCGAEKVTTENTEVRSLQAGRDADPDSAAASPGEQPSGPDETAQDAESTAESTEPSPAQSPSSGTVSDAGETSAFTSPADAIEDAEPGSTGDAFSADADGEDADGEDAIILDDEPDDEPGSNQWEEPAEPEADPDPEPVGEDAEMVDANAPSDRGQSAQSDGQQGHPAGRAEQSGADADHPGSQPGGASREAGSSAEPDTAVDRDRGEWPEPEEADDEGFDATPSADPTESTFQFGEDDAVVEADTGFTSVGPLDNAERTEADDLDYTIYCPECGFEQYAGGSSLRAGDICPECRKGYLAEDR
jgi:hypothetical protein